MPPRAPLATPLPITTCNISYEIYFLLIVSLILITNSSMLHVSLNNMLRSVNNVGLSYFTMQHL